MSQPISMNQQLDLLMALEATEPYFRLTNLMAGSLKDFNPKNPASNASAQRWIYNYITEKTAQKHGSTWLRLNEYRTRSENSEEIMSSTIQKINDFLNQDHFKFASLRDGLSQIEAEVDKVTLQLLALPEETRAACDRIVAARLDIGNHYVEEHVEKHVANKRCCILA